MALNQLGQGILRHLRMPVQQAVYSSTATQGLAGLGLSLTRAFAGGQHLDKDEVTSRVIDVTKHFEKIDPAKVRHHAHRSYSSSTTTSSSISSSCT
jgi:NADH dehydrogenase (ubiquinone) 1 alpha/beta subcomplex 1